MSLAWKECPLEKDVEKVPSEIRVDGGAISNNFLMQFQADICRCPVVRPKIQETTAFGAAYLAGLAVGFWSDLEDIKRQWNVDRVFECQKGEKEIDDLLRLWHQAVGCAQHWSQRECMG